MENNLLENIQTPLKLIVEAKRHGIKGFKRFFLILILFVFSNLVILGYAISNLISHDISNELLLSIVLVFLTGLIFTAIALYRAYQFLLMNALFFLYKSSKDLFKKMCDILVEKVAVFLKTENKDNNKKLEKILKVNDILSQNFNKIPRFFQKRIINWFNKIPMTELVFNVKDDIVNNQKEAASQKLNENVDLFITQNIFNSLNTKWVIWFYLLNIAVQIFIIKMFN